MRFLNLVIASGWGEGGGCLTHAKIFAVQYFAIFASYFTMNFRKFLLDHMFGHICHLPVAESPPLQVHNYFTRINCHVDNRLTHVHIFISLFPIWRR